MYHGPKLSCPDDARPAGKPDRCFYCQRPFGEGHGPDCVIPQRTVVLKYTVTLVQSVPAHWTPHDIEFHRNDGSWCANNLLGDLDHQVEEDHCLCNQVNVEFVSEATAENEAEMGWVARGEGE